ncbi:LysE family translocator [Paraburkholderia rhizosphaerae]|uniref:Threonine/homoserine/homoserine lactone efflux protein n=1 Tax=Paraburkholderia rhizosphaerae TaxID=480658 RepID=A0A4R8LSY8_9BURK|nr:LysE family transporter [Paraburkholderia rhizosphaerae]TDY50790.1 threonine/homoserine/homoserine lactone efflux protein [Paraburkholderia rhizosphaerae]
MASLYTYNLVSLASIYFVTCASPGPDFVNVTSLSLNARRNGVFAAAGVALGCFIWSTTAAFGLGFLTSKLPNLVHSVKLFGAIYLVYLGASLILASFMSRERTTASAPTRPGSVLNGWVSLRRGLITDLTNPTLLVFFGSLFAATLPSSSPLWVRCASIFTITFIAGSWHLALALFFSSRSTRSVYERLRRPVDVILGALLVLLAIRLVMLA